MEYKFGKFKILLYQEGDRWGFCVKRGSKIIEQSLHGYVRKWTAKRAAENFCGDE